MKVGCKTRRLRNCEGYRGFGCCMWRGWLAFGESDQVRFVRFLDLNCEKQGLLFWIRMMPTKCFMLCGGSLVEGEPGEGKKWCFC
jgi:hypothetical protein